MHAAGSESLIRNEEGYSVQLRRKISLLIYEDVFCKRKDVKVYFFFRPRMCCLVSGNVNLKKDSSSAGEFIHSSVRDQMRRSYI